MARVFFVVWLLVVFVALIGYLLRVENRLFLIFVVFLVAVSLILFIKVWLRRRREGFYINTRGNADGGDVIYHEEDKTLTFYFNRVTRTVYLPSNRQWEEEMPNWARSRKAEIVERIRSHIGRNWRFQDKPE